MSLKAGLGPSNIQRSARPGNALGSRDYLLCLPACYPKVIYTINAIESINAQLRKVIKTWGHFPNDEAAAKLIWLG